MKVRHILGISGGKDSAALAIYLKEKYPNLKIEYYNSDTGCELQETYVLIDRLKASLGKIKDLKSVKNENLLITGRICSPVRQGQHLAFGYRIDQQR